MKITHDSPENQAPGTAASGGAFTLAQVRSVRDFTARKTLEQAHAFVAGMTRVVHGAARDDDDAALLADLARAGITVADAQRLAWDALSLMDRMADRDREAERFHAAVKDAAARERAMYERLAGLARLLRRHLGPRAPALAKLGVPPEPGALEPRASASGPEPRRSRRGPLADARGSNA